MTTQHAYYVLGFVFDDENGNVLLVRKNRPDALKGLLNGVGGVVENISRRSGFSPHIIGRVDGLLQISPDYEYPIMSMIRECFDETGLFIPANHWIELGTLGGDGHAHTIFLYGAGWRLARATQKTDEEIVTMGVEEALARDDLAPGVHGILSQLHEKK